MSMPPPARRGSWAKAGVITSRASEAKTRRRTVHGDGRGLKSGADYSQRVPRKANAAGSAALRPADAVAAACASLDRARRAAGNGSRASSTDRAMTATPSHVCPAETPIAAARPAASCWPASPTRWSAWRRRLRRSPDLAAADAFVWHPAPRRLAPVPRVNRVEMVLLKGIDRVRDTLLENTERFAARPAGQQRPALGRARHGQVVAGQGRPCAGQRRRRRHGPPPLKLVEIHREDIESLPALMALLRAGAVPLHRVLRRPVLRRRRHVLQVAEGGAGRRHRGPAGQRHLLRHLEPPPPAAARHDGERALDGDQSRRGGRGEGLAVRPLRPVARLPQVQPGRISRHGRRLCRPFRAAMADRDALRAEALEWATTRGSRSGRTAWQFIQDLAGAARRWAERRELRPLWNAARQRSWRPRSGRPPASLRRADGSRRKRSTFMRPPCRLAEAGRLAGMPELRAREVRHRIDRGRALAQLEVELRRGDVARSGRRWRWSGRGRPCSPRFTFSSPLWA